MKSFYIYSYDGGRDKSVTSGDKYATDRRRRSMYEHACGLIERRDVIESIAPIFFSSEQILMCFSGNKWVLIGITGPIGSCLCLKLFYGSFIHVLCWANG